MERNILHGLTYMCNLKKESQIYRDRELTVGTRVKERGVRRGNENM